jgi:hypothetical protein
MAMAEAVIDSGSIRYSLRLYYPQEAKIETNGLLKGRNKKKLIRERERDSGNNSNMEALPYIPDEASDEVSRFSCRPSLPCVR